MGTRRWPCEFFGSDGSFALATGSSRSRTVSRRRHQDVVL